MDLSTFTETFAPRLAMRLEVQRKEMLRGPPQPGDKLMTLRAGFGGSHGAQRIVAPIVEQFHLNHAQPHLLLLGPKGREGDQRRYLLNLTYWFLHAIRWPEDRKEEERIYRLFEEAAWERYDFNYEKKVSEEVLR